MDSAIGGSVILGLLLYHLFKAGVRAREAMLQNRFAALGPLAGKTLGEISAAVSASPTATSTNQVGTLAQWQATGYHIAIQFGRDGKFVGITHQYSAAGIRPT
jgi:hypothetical protein